MNCSLEKWKEAHTKSITLKFKKLLHNETHKEHWNFIQGQERLKVQWDKINKWKWMQQNACATNVGKCKP